MYVKKNKIFSSILSIYDEEEVCKEVDCELFKSIQPIGRPTSKTDNYDTYSNKILKYVYNYLFGNEDSAETVLHQIEDITKIYYIKLDDSIVLIFLTIAISISIVIIISLILLLTRRFKPYFNFLSTDFWFLIIVGFILIIFSSFPEIGKKNDNKCHIKLIIISLGLSLNLLPILHRLIINMPFQNKFLESISNHKYIFVFFFIAIDILLYIMYLSTSYTIEYVSIDEGKNFEICSITNIFGFWISMFIIIVKIFIILAIIILCYLEWNIKNTKKDIHFLILAIYTDILILIALTSMNFVKLESYKMYEMYFILSECICIFYVAVNYNLSIGFRIIRGILGKDNDETLFIKKINQGFTDSNVAKSYCTTDQNLFSVDYEYLKTKRMSEISETNENYSSNNYSSNNGNSYDHTVVISTYNRDNRSIYFIFILY